jgi:hypothetical protein
MRSPGSRPKGLRYVELIADRANVDCGSSQ